MLGFLSPTKVRNINIREWRNHGNTAGKSHPGNNSLPTGNRLESTRNPLQKALSHKDTNFMKSSLSLIKTVNSCFMLVPTLLAQPRGYTGRERDLSDINLTEKGGKDGKTRV